MIKKRFSDVEVCWGAPLIAWAQSAWRDDMPKSSKRGAFLGALLFAVPAVNSFQHDARFFVKQRTAAVGRAPTTPFSGLVRSAEQVGNDAFLNENLMERAQQGPGVVSQSKLKVAVIGCGLAGMVAAMDLADAGHEVEMFESRRFVGGKVSSWQDKDGNHIEVRALEDGAAYKVRPMTHINMRHHV